MKDNVNHPSHYTAGGIECIDAITAALSYHDDPTTAWLTGQVIKYLWRFPLKGGVEDLQKAKWYLNRLIDREAQKDEDYAREQESTENKAEPDRDTVSIPHDPPYYCPNCGGIAYYSSFSDKWTCTKCGYVLEGNYYATR